MCLFILCCISENAYKVCVLQTGWPTDRSIRCDWVFTVSLSLSAAKRLFIQASEWWCTHSLAGYSLIAIISWCVKLHSLKIDESEPSLPHCHLLLLLFVVFCRIVCAVIFHWLWGFNCKIGTANKRMAHKRVRARIDCFCLQNDQLMIMIDWCLKTSKINLYPPRKIATHTSTRDRNGQTSKQIKRISTNQQPKVCFVFFWLHLKQRKKAKFSQMWRKFEFYPNLFIESVTAADYHVEWFKQSN